ncbi:MAG TPA: type II CAAX endopeptidase family protein [Spirosoma sp.]|nr:type II CAAX endopeptidase family protein [Spirosoma sp.]
MSTLATSTSINRQLTQFFGLTYAISWLIWSPYYLPLGVPAHQLPYVHLLGSLGPMLAALVLIFREQGFGGLRRLAGQADSRRHFFRWMIIGFVLPIFVLHLIISFICIRQHDGVDWNLLFSSREYAFLSPGVYVLTNLFFFGFGEEVGWRGYALPRLQSRYSAFTANLIITAFWAFWHWPLFLNPLGGYGHMDIGELIGWLFSLVTGGVLFTWLFNSSRGNVLACALFHGMMDVVFMANLNLPQLSTFTGIVVTTWGLYVWLTYKPVNLSKWPKVTF